MRLHVLSLLLLLLLVSLAPAQYAPRYYGGCNGGSAPSYYYAPPPSYYPPPSYAPPPGVRESYGHDDDEPYYHAPAPSYYARPAYYEPAPRRSYGVRAEVYADRPRVLLPQRRRATQCGPYGCP